MIKIHILLKEPTKKKIGSIKALLLMESFKVMANLVLFKEKATATMDNSTKDSLTDTEHYNLIEIRKKLRVSGMPEF